MALFVLVGARLVAYKFQWNRDAPITLVILFVSLLLLGTAYLQFKEWCNVRDSVLRSVVGGGAEITMAEAARTPTTSATTEAVAGASSRSETPEA
jgi:hypothetical protein